MIMIVTMMRTRDEIWGARDSCELWVGFSAVFSFAIESLNFYSNDGSISVSLTLFFLLLFFRADYVLI